MMLSKISNRGQWIQERINWSCISKNKFEYKKLLQKINDQEFGNDDFLKLVILKWKYRIKC